MGDKTPRSVSPEHRESSKQGRTHRSRSAEVRNSTSMLPTQSQTRTPVGPTHALSKPDVFFSLEIETTNTAPCKGMLVNRFEEENSEIKALHAGTVTRVDKDKYEHIDLTPEELAE